MLLISNSNTNESIIDSLGQFFCAKTRELSAKKQNALLSNTVFPMWSPMNFLTLDPGHQMNKVAEISAADCPTNGKW